MTKCRPLLLVSVAWLIASGATLRAQGPEIAILEKATTALNDVEAMPFDSLPYHRFMTAQLRKAQGDAIFPDMFKAAVGIGGRKGRGVLLIREADGSWGPPIFRKLSGVSAGIQLGTDRTDLVLTCRTRSNSEHLKKKCGSNPAASIRVPKSPPPARELLESFSPPNPPDDVNSWQALF